MDSRLIGVLEHGAGAQQVVVEGLSFVVRLEKRRLQRFEQAHVVDVGVRVVDEHTGLDVACGVDVQVTPPARDAAADEFSVVLEIKREQGFFRTHRANEPIEMLALLDARHQLDGRIGAHGHEREDPTEQGACVR